jgi:hypothetical protein
VAGGIRRPPLPGSLLTLAERGEFSTSPHAAASVGDWAGQLFSPFHYLTVAIYVSPNFYIQNNWVKIYFTIILDFDDPTQTVLMFLLGHLY